MSLPNILFSVFVLLCSVFVLLAGRQRFSFPHRRFNFLCFSSYEIRLLCRPLFSITRSSSFSVIHVSVNTKNNAKKDTTLLLSGRPCDFLSNKTWSCIWVTIPVDWVILHGYACGADGRSLALSLGVRSHVYQIFSDQQITTFPQLWGFVPRVELRHEHVKSFSEKKMPLSVYLQGMLERQCQLSTVRQ